MRGWSRTTFLANLRTHGGNVAIAAELSGASRAAVYAARASSSEFAAEWTAALEAARRASIAAAAQDRRRRGERRALLW